MCGKLDLSKTPWNVMRQIEQATLKELAFSNSIKKQASGEVETLAPKFPQGEEVAFKNLRQRSELNGTFGSVISCDTRKAGDADEGFAVVRLSRSGGASPSHGGHQTMRVRASRLERSSSAALAPYMPSKYQPPAGDLSGKVSSILIERYARSASTPKSDDTVSVKTWTSSSPNARLDLDGGTAVAHASTAAVSDDSRTADQGRKKHGGANRGTGGAAGALSSPAASTGLARRSRIPSYPSDLTKSNTGVWQVSRTGAIPRGWAGH
eukprot:TRINITY_DN21747_c0_g1_i1.p1 TRINITY_DN21747_c0_g1~~TRINITY_DN21747_c0_g1_i1.p1  ORF type:complete len:266 (-),score=36.09 TRINITY_DN21747_c0_g1_i1:118-915(-)